MIGSPWMMSVASRIGVLRHRARTLARTGRPPAKRFARQWVAQGSLPRFVAHTLTHSPGRPLSPRSVWQQPGTRSILGPGAAAT